MACTLWHCEELEEATADGPAVSISDAQAREGKTMMFTISLSKPISQAVTIRYGTTDVTADEDDYMKLTGTYSLTLQANQTSANIYITTKEDNLDEDDETFLVVISNAVNASIADGEGTGTIINSATGEEDDNNDGGDDGDDGGDTGSGDDLFITATIAGTAWKGNSGNILANFSIYIVTLGIFGTDGSQLSVLFNQSPKGIKTYGVDAAAWLYPDSDDDVTASYSTDPYSVAVPFYYAKTGEFVITAFDADTNVAEGTFSFTMEDENENTISVTDGAFRLPVED